MEVFGEIGIVNLAGTWVRSRLDVYVYQHWVWWDC